MVLPGGTVRGCAAGRALTFLGARGLVVAAATPRRLAEDWVAHLAPQQVDRATVSTDAVIVVGDHWISGDDDVRRWPEQSLLYGADAAKADVSGRWRPHVLGHAAADGGRHRRTAHHAHGVSALSSNSARTVEA